VADDIGQRWGSGEVTITSVKLTNKTGTTERLFHTGDPLLISIEFDSQVELANSSIAVRIDHLHGTDIWGTSTDMQSIIVPIKIGQGRISLNLDHLPLLDGTYDLSVVIADHAAIREFDHWEKRVRFDVNQKSISNSGLVDIQSEWLIEK
jgi:hypothetical protein